MYIGEHFQYLLSCSVKLIEFQTFDFVMYKIFLTITIKPACIEMLSECKKQVFH